MLGRETQIEEADRFAANIMPVIEAVRISGIFSLAGIADALNNRGIRSARGGRWHVSTVQNLLARAEISARIGLARRMQWPGTKPDLANQPEWVT
ncbi:MAG: recombinase family protein [Rhizobiales bacterium]|nr:recombinase family protein [Hyphomicrobiales bacterium]